jgi:uncharacterized membrane protein YecN with MAPEG domain
MRHSAPPASRSRRQRRAAPSSRPGASPGPHRAAASGAGWLQYVPYAIVLCGLALALVWVRENGQNVKGGTLAVAGIVFAAALARLALPERRAGMLVSRRRLADVAVLAALGTGLLVAGLVLPGH